MLGIQHRESGEDSGCIHCNNVQHCQRLPVGTTLTSHTDTNRLLRPSSVSDHMVVNASSLQVCSSTPPLQQVMDVHSLELSASCSLPHARCQTLNSVDLLKRTRGKHFNTVWTKRSFFSPFHVWTVSLSSHQQLMASRRCSPNSICGGGIWPRELLKGCAGVSRYKLTVVKANYKAGLQIKMCKTALRLGH